MLRPVVWADNLNKFLQKRLFPNNEQEVYLFLILFRRKWLINRFPEHEEYFRKLFLADEMLLSKFLINYTEESNLSYVIAKIINKLSLFHEDFSKVYKYKDVQYASTQLFHNYRDGLSLMVTFRPRSLKKGFKKFLKELFYRTLDNPESLTDIFLTKLEKFYLSCIHSCGSNKNPYLLIDFDVDWNANKIQLNEGTITIPVSFSKRLEYLAVFCERLAEVFKTLNVIGKVQYVCSTPSLGLHCICKLDKTTGKLFFKGREKFLKKVNDITKNSVISFKEISFNSNQVLTHVPIGINPQVTDLTMFFKD